MRAVVRIVVGVVERDTIAKQVNAEAAVAEDGVAQHRDVRADGNVHSTRGAAGNDIGLDGVVEWIDAGEVSVAAESHAVGARAASAGARQIGPGAVRAD